MVKIVVGYIGRLAAASLSPLHADRSTTGVCNVTYLPLHGEEDGPSGGVVEHPVAPDTEIGALGLQHDGAVSVSRRRRSSCTWSPSATPRAARRTAGRQRQR
jgi:hypothetical protein